MNDNYENLKICKDAAIFCRYQPNPCCRYTKLKIEKPCGKLDCLYWNENYWSWEKPGLLRFIVFMLTQIIIQYTVLMLIENSSIRKLNYSLNRKQSSQKQKSQLNQNEKFGDDLAKDSDVIREENRITNLLKNKKKSDIFIVEKLAKYYSDFIAVKGISFGMNKTECFGLLGNCDNKFNTILLNIKINKKRGKWSW